MERRRRTLVKTITWRMIGLCITIVVVYAYSGNARESFTIGIVANAIKMAVYYAHERLWNRIHFGRDKGPEYQI